MGSTSLEGSVGVGDSATGVVVEVGLDITADDTTKSTDEIVNLTGVGATNSVGNTDAVDADLVDGPVDGQQVDKLGAERVFRREADLNTLGLDELNDCAQVSVLLLPVPKNAHPQ